jgi:tRNA pseudouridine38-40 synthase
VDVPDCTRFRLIVEYDGSAFHGWQVQPDQRTIQGELESALSRLADCRRGVIGSGRTDTGVHADGQVASVDMPSSWTVEALHRSLNSVVSPDIRVRSVSVAAPDFHPRYDALRRTYRYEVGLSESAGSPFHRRWCWPLGEALARDRDGRYGDARDSQRAPDRADPNPPNIDRDLLAQAAATVVGAHSFERFAKTGQPERGYRCHVIRAAWSDTDLGVRLTITADRYLHHMVRYLVGTMVDVARCRRPLDDMTRLLARDPDLVTSPPAPAEGLFLHHVEYPGDPAVGNPPDPTDSADIDTTPRSTAPA